MEELITKSRGKIARVQKSFQRELLHQINWSSRLIALKGARGVGKTTLLLQAAAIKLSKADNALYVSMDDLFFQENTLYQLAKTHALTGGTHLFVDEVHKYPNWSRELKLIYDDFEEIKVVFTSSSILEIFQGESDLSRRAIAYTLFELSFREFIAFDQKTVIKPYSLDDILLHSAEIELEILPQLKPIPAFQDYLKYGAYPYFLEGKDVFAQRLTQVVNLIIEVDLNAVDNLTYDMIVKTKKLLAAIAT
ncbi:MAG: AAA family ATPase, partial [Salibacteraceae bacterium]|nr:AAA family ATPase [Salibacteraceae bacterium]